MGNDFFSLSLFGEYAVDPRADRVIQRHIRQTSLWESGS